MARSHSLGQLGEDLAAEHLAKNGFTILARNWKTGKREIDIIAADENFVIFTEVKTRMADFQLHPLDAISVPKQRNIIFAAQTWLERNPDKREARFDVITVIIDGNRREIEHIEDAFYPTL